MRNETKAREVAAPVMALDLGEKRVGVAVCDALRISIRRLSPLKRSNWKRLLGEVSTLTRRFDAKTLVIGLPLNIDGTTGDSATEATRLAMNFAKSLEIPVFLQDERLTSVEAKENLEREGVDARDVVALLDSEAAAIILRDFLDAEQARLRVSASEEN
jgi:putative Holliday junction resolvase